MLQTKNIESENGEQIYLTDKHCNQVEIKYLVSLCSGNVRKFIFSPARTSNRKATVCQRKDTKEEAQSKMMNVFIIKAISIS